VALIGRPGTDLTLVADARSRIAQDPAVMLTGVEISWSAQWRQAWAG